MTQSVQTVTEALHFCPNNHDNISLQYYLNKAIDLIPQSIKDINVIYLMDIRHINENYSSLLIDSNGIWHKSEWSTTRIMDELFSSYGYNYQRWSQFLKKTYNRPRTIFPYVYNYKVYLRLQQPNRKHSDWVNLSLLKDLQATYKSQHCQELEQLHLSFSLEQKYSTRKFTIQLNSLLSQINTQIGYAFQLVNFWYDFQNSIKITDTNFQITPLQTYIGNPAYKLLKNQRIDYRKRLKERLDLEQFIKYNTIYDYVRNKGQFQTVSIKQLLKLSLLQQQLFETAQSK